LNWLFNPLPKVLRLAEANMAPLIRQRVSTLHARNGERDVDVSDIVLLEILCSLTLTYLMISQEDFLDEILRSKSAGPLDTLLTTKRVLSASFAAIHTTATVSSSQNSLSYLQRAWRPEPCLEPHVRTLLPCFSSWCHSDSAKRNHFMRGKWPVVEGFSAEYGEARQFSKGVGTFKLGISR